jgi:DNA-binding LacI/PurR family transcriptional regulator
MSDIAKRAGVSLSTVSYSLSGKRSISAETRRRVLAAMEELDFQPHAVGRALASRSTRTVALLYPALAKGITEVGLEFVTSAAETAERLGYSFLLSVHSGSDAHFLRLARHGVVDGLILMEVALDDHRVHLLQERNMPFALIGHCANNDGINFVDLDFEDVIEQSVRHLAALGHRRIVLVNSSRELVAAGYGPAVRSLSGFERVIVASGLVGESYSCEPSYEAGYELVTHLITADPAPTGLIVHNREALGGLIQAALDRGIGVPEHLSVVAIVTDRLAKMFTPTLTSVDFPAAEMGRMGVELLIKQLEGGVREPTQCLLRASLTARQSSGPCRKET